MNAAAERHLAKAEGYLTRGESFYHRAVEEIVAAQTADSTLSNREIGKRFDRSEAWVRKLVQWHTSGSTSISPYSEDGPHSRASSGHQDITATKKTLRDAPIEQIERILDELPDERKKKIAGAAGDAYFGRRVEFEEAERNLTPAQRSEREAGVEELTRPVRQAAAGFATLGIVGHLDQALEEIHELVDDGSLTKKLVREIDRALQRIEAEMQVARGLVGLEEE